MKPLTCAGLFARREQQILLVRVRNNKHWYLAGGKIEPAETPRQALLRELAEELSIEIEPSTIRQEFVVIGPAYDQQGDVELICFSAKWRNEPSPRGEITEAAWLDGSHYDLFAPAIKILYDRWIRSSPLGATHDS
jgi:8-oxo-dGTP diphosphatase